MAKNQEKVKPWIAVFEDRGATVTVRRPTYPRLAVARDKMIEQYKARFVRVCQGGV
jgi:hypothetical protein